jgi:hypothetical protein
MASTRSFVSGCFSQLGPSSAHAERTFGSIISAICLIGGIHTGGIHTHTHMRTRVERYPEASYHIPATGATARDLLRWALSAERVSHADLASGV